MQNKEGCSKFQDFSCLKYKAFIVRSQECREISGFSWCLLQGYFKQKSSKGNDEKRKEKEHSFCKCKNLQQ